MSCDTAMPKTFTLHRGKVDAVMESSAFSSDAVPFTAPGMAGFIESVTKSRKADDTSVDLAIPCGIEDAQFFGEMFRDWTGVATACACKQLCVDHVDEGCATWKWYDETQHCFLQRDVFEGTDPDGQVTPQGALSTSRATYRPRYESGSGWWKRPFARGWPGWVTGETGPLAMGLTTTPETPVIGQAFTVQVTGSGFPLDESMADDLGARQRIKIIPEGRSCVTEMPPDYVEGVDCTNWFTCSPRPDAYTRTSATWTGLAITAQKEDTDYKVCWCHGQCWNVVNWAEVPGKIKVAASPYTWALDPAAGTPTRMTAQAGMELRISRPAFSSTAPNADWRVKAVKDVHDCENLGDAEFCDGNADCGAPMLYPNHLGPDEAIWILNASASVASGDYHVCMSEDAGVTYNAIPSAMSRFLTIHSLATDSSHPRGPFHHQSASALAGASASIGIAGFRMWLPNQASMAVVDGDACSMTTWDDVIAVLKPDADTSTDAEYRFTGDIPVTSKGKYALCMCDVDAWIENMYEARPSSWPGGAYYYQFSHTDDTNVFYTDNTTETTDATFTPAYGVAESKFSSGGVTLSA